MDSENKKLIPLFVDLDGTLVSTDTLWESCLLYLKEHPLQIWRIAVWLFRGKAHFKEQIALNATLNVELLPYNVEVVKYVSNAKEKNRNIYLLTAANQRIADNVAKTLNFFTSAIGSSDTLNLKGSAKLGVIRDLIGNGPFDYIGDSKTDIPIWKEADTVIVCNNFGKIIDKINKDKDKIIVLSENSKSKAKQWLKALRLYQWAKNMLLFLALFMSHKLLEPNLFIQVALAFFSFSLSASAVYILNDLFDLAADRKHPSKKYRPFAAGHLPLASGVLAIPILLIISFVLAIAFLPNAFIIVLIAYLIITTSYSLYLKEQLFLDVIILGALYTLRVLAGGLAVEIEVSTWLLGFSMFFFLSLAFMKRYTDLMLFKKNNQEEVFGRGYSINDLEFVQRTGITSGLASLLILVLYINSDQVIALYKQPALIWLTIPILLYWLMRMWVVAHRGQMTDDPIIFAIKDKSSYVMFFIIISILIAAANFNFSI